MNTENGVSTPIQCFLSNYLNIYKFFFARFSRFSSSQAQVFGVFEESQVTATNPGQLLGKFVGNHDVLSSFVDISDDTLDGVVDFLGLCDSSLFWVVLGDGPNGVSPAATTGKIGLKFAWHVALRVVNLSVSTEGV